MKFDFTPKEWGYFFEHCSFTDDEREVIYFRRRGWELSRIAAELNWSERTINRRISSIAHKIINAI